MPKSAPPSPRSHLVGYILAGWFYLAVFGVLWRQFGVRITPLILAWIVLGIVMWCIHKSIPVRRPSIGDAGPDSLHERIFSPVPVEAELARSRLMSDLAIGIVCLAVVSSLLATITGAPFLIVFAAVTASAVFTGAMVLAWAMSRVAHPNQFSLATLVILITISAVYLSVIRLLVDWSGDQLGKGSHSFLAVTVYCFAVAGFCLPPLLIFLVRLVWLAAWLVRRPRVQKWLQR